MKWIFIIIVIIHGLIHSLGFVKAFNLSEIKELSLPVSKAMGVIWLLTALAFLVYTYCILAHHKYSWIVGLVAVFLSQLLVIIFWKDARYGTIPNLFILIYVIIGYGSFAFDAMVLRERASILSTPPTDMEETFKLNEIQNLPDPVKNWIISSGAIDQVKKYNGRISQNLKMKMKAEQKNWYVANAAQHTTIDKPAFLWTVELGMNPFIWIKGRDKYVDGKGEMLIKMNALINIVKEAGEKIDEGSLQRFLGEMVWFPNLAVCSFITWENIDSVTARARMDYNGTVGEGIFHFNKVGDFIKFTAMRYQGNDPDSEHKEWILTVDDYQVFEGIKVPSKMKATWNLDDGPWTWLELEIEEIDYNVAF